LTDFDLFERRTRQEIIENLEAGLTAFVSGLADEDPGVSFVGALFLRVRNLGYRSDRTPWVCTADTTMGLVA
jgi:hypothetical protein